MYEELGKAVYELLEQGQALFVSAETGQGVIIAAFEVLPAPNDYLVLGTLPDVKPQNGYEKATAQPPKVRKTPARLKRVSGLEPLTCCLGSNVTEDSAPKSSKKTTSRRRR